MSEAFLGEIRLMSFNFPPRGWLQCNGQLLPISQYAALFSLLGTTFGGNGTSTFGVPNLNGRAPLGTSDSYPTGQQAGVTQVTLTTQQIPMHTHIMSATDTLSDSDDPSGMTLGQSTDASYGSNPNGSVMGSSTFATAGESAAHTNAQPLLVISFCIATVGLYPSRP
jgi:microcystin-dependent protein